MIRFVVLTMVLICATGLFRGQSMAQGPTSAPPREAPIKDSNLKEAFFGQTVGTAKIIRHDALPPVAVGRRSFRQKRGHFFSA